jgi:hypothetical protein
MNPGAAVGSPQVRERKSDVKNYSPHLNQMLKTGGYARAYVPPVSSQAPRTSVHYIQHEHWECMVMIKNSTFAIVAACLVTVATIPESHAAAQRHTVTVKHAPITSPGDVSGSWSARRNVIDSKQYEHMLRTNPAFRQARMRKECGSITDPQLRASCMASFDRYVGSSTPLRHYRNSAGR